LPDVSQRAVGKQVISGAERLIESLKREKIRPGYKEAFELAGGEVADISNIARKTEEILGQPLSKLDSPTLSETMDKLRALIPKPVTVPDYAKRLPKPIQRFTTNGVYDLAKKTHLSFTQGAGHGGSHPHLVHEFLTALVEDRDPFPNARQSANWTCVGLCAHQSALKGGAIVKLPPFTL
jgi:hypothetical protein